MGERRTEQKRITEMEALLTLLSPRQTTSGSSTAFEEETQLLYRTPLEEDLKTPLDPEAGGPLSLERLADVGPGMLEFCRGRSLLQLFLDPALPVEALTLLKDTGKRLIGPGLPDRVRTLGRALYFLGVSAALTHRGERIGSLGHEEFRKGLGSLGQLEEIDPELAGLCRTALEKWTGQGPDSDAGK
ncbi:MAG: hypothetical protein ACYS47_09995 [Planctomycetota bacterium]|jgi:hypothetical protein